MPAIKDRYFSCPYSNNPRKILLQRPYYKGGVGRLNSFSKIVFQVGESIYILSCILSLKAWPYSSRSNLSRANNPISILMGPGSRNFESESHTVVSDSETPWTVHGLRDGMGREVGGVIGMGNTCKSMADSCQCMAKTTTIL